MSEASGRDAQQYRINDLQWVNNDPYLSQFKHHLLLRRVYIPQSQFNDFVNNLYHHFRPKIAPSAIYIAQIVESYDHFFYDVAVGFRRDAQAIYTYEKNKRIFINGKEVELQLCEIFKIYAQSREWNQRKRRRSRSPSFSSSARKRRKDSSRKSYSRSRSVSQSSSYSSSSSARSSFKRILYLPLVPHQWKREQLESRLCQQLNSDRNQLSIQQRRGDIACMMLTVRNSQIYSELLDNFRLGQYALLFLRQQDVQTGGLKQQLKKHQFKAYKNESGALDAFQDLIQVLSHSKNILGKVVMISCFESSFVVTSQIRVQMVLKMLKAPGWRFQAVNYPPRLNPSLQDRWFQYLWNRNKIY